MRTLKSPLSGPKNPFGSKPRVPPPFLLALTGLSTDAIGLYGPPGDHASISYTATDLEGTPIVLDSLKWSSSSNAANAATYGTGSSPDDYTASFGSYVWLHATFGADTVSKAFQVRLIPAFSTQPSIDTPAYVNGPIFLDYGAADFATTEIVSLIFNGTDVTEDVQEVDGDDEPIPPRITGLSGLFVYGSTNTLVLRTVAKSQFGETLSNEISATVYNVPAQMAAPTTTAVNANTISTSLASAPDGGGLTITSYVGEWTTNINADPVVWVRVEGISNPWAQAGFNPVQQVWTRTAAVNDAGLGAFSDPDDATTSAGAPAVSPQYETLQFIPGGLGVPDKLRALGWAYSGADQINFYGVTSTAAIMPGATDADKRANIKAGTGTGTLEEFSLLDTDLATVDVAISGLTSASEAATYFHGFFEEDANGGFSLIRTAAASTPGQLLGLDFTAPTLVSAATNTAGTQTTLTFSEALFDASPNTADWTLDEDTVPVSISNVSINSNLVTLTHTAVTGGTTLTISYSGGSVTDGKTNALATITDASVTNNADTPASNVFTAGAELIAVEELRTLPALTFTAGVQLITVSGDTGMTRTVFYREKTGPGAWQRASGTTPFNITGLTASTVYEIDNEDGTLVERTPTAAASLTFVLGATTRLASTSDPLVFDFDTSTMTTGDKLAIVISTQSAPSGSVPEVTSVDGVAPSAAVYSSGTNNSYRNTKVYEYTLPGAGKATFPITLSKGASPGTQVTIWGYRGGSIASANSGVFNNLATVSASITPAGTDNLILASIHATNNLETGLSWSNVTADHVGGGDTTGHGIGAKAEDVAASPLTVSASWTNTRQGNLTVLCVEPD